MLRAGEYLAEYVKANGIDMISNVGYLCMTMSEALCVPRSVGAVDTHGKCA